MSTVHYTKHYKDKKRAAKVLGRELCSGEELHHHTVDILVICEDHEYHALLHQRARALEACGHASWRKCTYCKGYDDPANLTISGRTIYHKKCANKQQRIVYSRHRMVEWLAGC